MKNRKVQLIMNVTCPDNITKAAILRMAKMLLNDGRCYSDKRLEHDDCEKRDEETMREKIKSIKISNVVVLPDITANDKFRFRVLSSR